MTERAALEATYFDSAAVYRFVQTRDEDTKQIRQTETLVSEQLICALSRDKTGALSLSDGYGTIANAFTLFCAPDAPVCAGDRLVVTTLAGQIFTLWAGDPFAYAGSHSEIPLTTEKRT